jgi:signal transduction histidine kinase
MIVRFRNNANEVLAEKSFPVHGQTPGWTGRFSNTTFISRKETVTVPPGATRYWVVISSAGPPEAVGVYVIRDLFVSQPTITTNRISMIPPLAPDTPDAPPGHSPAPEGWIRDGLRLSDAQVVRYGAGGKVALAILDEGVDGHADWATLKEANSAIVAGAPLVLEWQEAYSIGRGDYGSPTYQDVAPGLYQFRMAGFTVMGLPTGTEDSVLVSVPVPLWATPFFWSMVLLAGLGFAVAGWRVIDWRRMMQQVKLMEQDRAIEVERVRIARDIHDDLGARVTQISLLSSAAEKRDGLTEQARQDFEQVSELSRSMVTALYETVWAVDPENDHLDELGAYICQMATQMCAQVKLKCRLMVPDLPQDVPLGSRIRHEIIMVIKEAIHNVIKHSGASELQIRILFENGLLSITLSDNGSGFDPAEQRLGNGLSNMKRRMESCQGTCSLQSRPGSGTHIRLQLPLLDGRTAQPRFSSKTPNGSKK